MYWQESKQATYVEIGAGPHPSRPQTSEYLLKEDWQTHIETQRTFSAEMLNMFSDVPFFEGYFVEPVPSQVQALLQNMGEHTNAHIIPCAVSGQVGLKTFDIDACGLGYLKDTKLTHIGWRVVSTLKIITLSLDTLFDYLAITPDLLRIDIEGAEVETLYNYSFHRKPRCITVDAHQVNDNTVMNILQKHGYECKMLTPIHGITEDIVGFRQ